VRRDEGFNEPEEMTISSGSTSAAITLASQEGAPGDGDVALELSDFTAVFKRYAHFVYSVLRRLQVPESAVDDALQEVFLVGYRRRRSFDPDASLRSWLYGITIRVARAQNRRAALQRLLLFPLREDDDVGVEEPGYERVENDEALVIVDQLLQRLPAKQREVFVLAELEGLTAREIASSLGCNVNTVYSRLRLARERFEAAAARQRRRQEQET
jgi:RNA polymerase sigma-70 factor (ECF subfamily)